MNCEVKSELAEDIPSSDTTGPKEMLVVEDFNAYKYEEKYIVPVESTINEIHEAITTKEEKDGYLTSPVSSEGHFVFEDNSCSVLSTEVLLSEQSTVIADDLSEESKYSTHLGEVKSFPLAGMEESVPRTIFDSLEKKYYCSHCDYKSNCRSNCNFHIKGVHLKVKKYVCNYCGYCAGLKGGLRVHINSVHLKLKHLTCDQCDYKTCQRTKLDMHIKAVHEKLKDVFCPYCQYKTSRKANVDQHIKFVHLKQRKEKKFVCHLCDYKGNRMHHLNQHMQTMHSGIEKYKCEECDYKSTTKIDLRVHIDSFHSKLPKRFACDICGHAAYHRGSINRHVRFVHMKIKNLGCDQCDFKTNDRSRLARHRKHVHKVG